VSVTGTVEERVRQGYLDLLDHTDEPRTLIESVLSREAPLLGASQADEVVARVVSQVRGLGAIDQVWSDESVTDVLINGPGPIWVERHGSLQRTPWAIDAEELDRVVERVFGRIGVRVDRAQPIADGRLEDGSRISVVLPPIALAGPVVSIRRFAVRHIAITAFVPPDVVELMDELIRARANVMVYGGTGSGKTTLLNAIAARFPVDDRVITVEDAAELRLPGEHVVGLESRRANSEGAGVTTIRDLVRAALRLRPDRIVVGEVRGAEALDMVWAMSSGHDGSMSTIHASTAVDAIRRLETFVAMDAIRLPLDAIRAQIGSAIDVLVGVERCEGGRRRVTAIDEVVADGAGPTVRALVRDGSVVDGPHRRPRHRGQS
jgi:pilus assembly protein CpaF